MPRSKRTWSRLRRAAVVGSATLTVVAAPSAALAADNLPPLKPLVQDLETDRKACATGAERPYVSESPRVTAVLYDPESDDQPAEGNFVQGEFEAWWTDADGAEQRRTHTSYPLDSGRAAYWQLPDDVPPNTVVSWRVRANDGEAVSAWSSEDGGSVCEFVVDDKNPEKPVVSSTDFPEGSRTARVGEYGTFTVDSPSDDVVKYRYSYIGSTYETASPEKPGGPVGIRFLPVEIGPETLSVQAIDHSGRISGTVDHRFYVTDGRGPVAHWNLADPAGTTSAAAETGPAARAGTGVTFGAEVPRGTDLKSTAGLDGTGHGFLSPGAAVTDTRRTFAVGGWVRPAATDAVRTVASQDADGAPGFTLGLRPGGDSAPVWSFRIGGAQVSGGTPETGEWAHVLGRYDAETGLATLYVNGHEVGTPQKATPAEAAGAFQIGRARGAAGYRDRWHGEVGDVRVYDRVVVPEEAAELGARTPELKGHWSLENADGGVSPELNGGAPLKLSDGATIRRNVDDGCGLDPDCTPATDYALVGDGDLTLDGTTGHAATDQPVVDTGDSFTIGVVVRLADTEPEHPMTVLSQGGEHADAFKVRYDPASHQWQLVVTGSDESGAKETVVGTAEAADGGQGRGRRLAVVYDDATDQIKLYVNGYTNAEATADFHGAWHSDGGLQVGRGQVDDGWGEYLRGSVDEVHAFSGALDESGILGLGFGT
ncbi:LamG-like jellyroll fold domain-containing protein [Streptomyces sp. NPDC046716]|uniref:LamG-like jellyroll fold domain-containing protein n=1 Tax=Streptomyces sp. NPDC046716 TaxID=3157093 RepID=UPI0033F9E957